MRPRTTVVLALAAGLIGAALTPAFANDTTADVLWRDLTFGSPRPVSFEAAGTSMPYVVASGPAPVVPQVAAGPAMRTSTLSRVDCTKVKCVALTFDDGPVPDTSRLLEMLRAEGVPATFFVVGHRVALNPEIVRAEVAAGHEVANHTQGHEQLTAKSDDSARHTVSLNQSGVTAATGGTTPTLFRPPYGAHNSRTDAVLASVGLPQILWDVDTLDWKTRNADQTVAAVQAQAQAGSIVLMHDIHPASVDAVPRVIQALKAKGLTLVTVSELLASQPPKPGQVVLHGPRVP